MLVLVGFHPARFASQGPGPATSHACTTSPIATCRTRSAVATLLASSSWTINGSICQALKLVGSRIRYGSQCVGGIQLSATCSTSVLRILLWRLRYGPGVVAACIRSIGRPPCFHTRFQLDHRRASSTFLPNNQPHSLRFTFSVPGWTLDNL